MATASQYKTIKWLNYGQSGFDGRFKLSITPNKGTASIDLTTTIYNTYQGTKYTHFPPGATTPTINKTVNVYWLMRIQRYNSAQKIWQTFTTVGGYVGGSSPSNRYISGIAKRDASLRVLTTIHWGAGGTGAPKVGEIISSYWMY